MYHLAHFQDLLLLESSTNELDSNSSTLVKLSRMICSQRGERQAALLHELRAPRTLFVNMLVHWIAWFVILVDYVDSWIDTRVRDHHGTVICSEATAGRWPDMFPQRSLSHVPARLKVEVYATQSNPYLFAEAYGVAGQISASIGFPDFVNLLVEFH